MRTLAIALSLVMLMFTAAPASATGYATPEDAIKAYVAAIAARDFDAVVATVAVDEMSSRFNFESYVTGARGVSWATPMPPTDPMFLAVNRESYVDRTAIELRMFVFTLLTKNPALGNGTTFLDAAGIAKFEHDVDAKRLSGISLIKVATPGTLAVHANSPIIIPDAQRARLLGADELAERIALFRFEGDTYYIGFTLVRYGKDWKVVYQFCDAGKLNNLGAPAPISPGDFDALMN